MTTNLWLKLFSMWVGFLILLPFSALAEDVRKHIAPELLPNSLQLSWQANKPSLGKFGQCAAAFDSKTDDAKMAFACSVYVKLTAVAERKAIQHCDEQRVARQIKAPCQLVR
ncbi:MAG: hypothetical protein RI892_91 [Pseudomonadota bacterium]|jgi:hypothetical protein